LLQARLEGVEHSSQDSQELVQRRVKELGLTELADELTPKPNPTARNEAHQAQKDYFQRKAKAKAFHHPTDFFIGQPTLHCSSSAVSSSSGGGS